MAVYQLLSRDDINNNTNELIKQRIKDCYLTDFVLAQGISAKNSADKIIGKFYTDDTHYDADGSQLVYLCEKGSFSYTSTRVNLILVGAIRPVFLFDDLNHMPITGKVERASDGILELEFGYYPQKIVTNELYEKLEKCFEMRTLKVTDVTYTYNEAIYSPELSPNYKVSLLSEYIYEGKKYVRFRLNKFHGSADTTFSNGVSLNNSHDYEWFEVLPIKWFVDEANKFAITNELLIGGIPYFKNDDKELAVPFMREIFAKEIIKNITPFYMCEDKINTIIPATIEPYFDIQNLSVSESVDEILVSNHYNSFKKNAFIFHSNKPVKLTFDEAVKDIMIEKNSFSNLKNIKKISFPRSVEFVDAEAFINSPDLELEFESSIFEFSSDDAKSYTGINPDFDNAFKVKKLKFYDTEISFDSNKTPFEQYKAIRSREYDELISFLLDKLKLVDRKNYFGTIVKAKLLGDDLLKFAPFLVQIDPKYEQLVNMHKKLFITTGPRCIWYGTLLHELESFTFKHKFFIPRDFDYKIKDWTKEFYFQKKNFTEKKDDCNTNILIINTNCFSNKNVYEVLECIKNLKIETLNDVNATTIMHYGKELDDYLEYVSNKYSEITMNKINADIDIDNLKNKIMKNKFVLKKGQINNELLNLINTFMVELKKKVEEEVTFLDAVRQIMYIYLAYTNTLVENLNTLKQNDSYLNVMIDDKISSLTHTMQVVASELEQMQLMLQKDFRMQTSITTMKNTLLPSLVIRYNDENSLHSNNENITKMQKVIALLDDMTNKESTTNKSLIKK